jgi:hypothetical protein
VGEPGERGAEWLEPGVAGKIFAVSDGTKLQESLEGSTTATVETVISVTDVASGNTRLVHFGEGTESGRFSLRADAPNEPVFFLDNNRQVAWDVSLAGPRVVLHLVFDSNQAQGSRARLFVDGVLRQPFNANVINPGSTIDISTDLPVEFHIGNRADATDADGRSPQGVIHYVALYEVALTETQIAQNAARLAESDDP